MAEKSTTQFSIKKGKIFPITKAATDFLDTHAEELRMLDIHVNFEDSHLSAEPLFENGSAKKDRAFLTWMIENGIDVESAARFYIDKNSEEDNWGEQD